MRLLHVSDWHLGRVLYNTARTSDHAEVLDEIENIAREFKPHLIIHSGDVWDLIRPAYVDLRSGIERLSALAGVAPVVVLCGNHDSPLLFHLGLPMYITIVWWAVAVRTLTQIARAEQPAATVLPAAVELMNAA